MLALSVLAPAAPSLEAQMNADTAGHDMKAQERRLAGGHLLSHYMPVGLTKEPGPPSSLRMVPGARVEAMPHLRSESALMPSGGERPADVHPRMEASSPLEEREEVQAARATSRSATMLFSPQMASPSERSGDPAWMAQAKKFSQ